MNLQELSLNDFTSKSRVKSFYKLLLILVLPLVIQSNNLFAQFVIEGQVLTRGEYRNGYNNLIDSGTTQANFIAHRVRLQGNYKVEDANFYISIQDIRTWGSTSQTNISDDFLSVHEAWVEANFTENWSVKLGRQELHYDNFRFLGNLDWALQARSHDLALVKYESGNSKLHMGLAYNQNTQALTGNLFTVPNQYKSAQLVRFENKFDDLHFSLLFWNDGRQSADSNNTNFRQTIGIPTLKYKMGDLSFSGFYYQQLGKDVNNKKISGFDVSAQLYYDINLNKESGEILRFTAGGEIISGSDGKLNNANKFSSISTTENGSYSPLYGTNHAHNGYMDMFYVGGQHENQLGLQDLFFKTKYNYNKNFFIQLDLHSFAAAADLYDANDEKLDKVFGTEVDLAIGYIFNSSVSLQFGYSQFFQTETFEKIRNKTNPADTQNWAYLMFIFRPNNINKFTGILF